MKDVKAEEEELIVDANSVVTFHQGIFLFFITLMIFSNSAKESRWFFEIGPALPGFSPWHVTPNIQG